MLVAYRAILSEPPDLVLSGVNHGPNMGEDVLYSGTVAAAMEATLLGIPALAISFAHDEWEPPGAEYEESLVRLLEHVAARSGRFPQGTLLNVNIPAIAPAELKGLRITSLGRRFWSESLTRGTDPSGREYYWIGGGESRWSGDANSDFQTVADGYISVTPLHLDMTNYRVLEEFSEWNADFNA